MSQRISGLAVLHQPGGARIATVSAADALRTELGKGANASQPDFQGATPLHLAAAMGDAAATQTLLEAGASPNGSDRCVPTSRRHPPEIPAGKDAITSLGYRAVAGLC